VVGSAPVFVLVPGGAVHRSHWAAIESHGAPPPRLRARGYEKERPRAAGPALRSSRDGHVGFFSYLFKSSAYIQALRATSNSIRDGQDLNFEDFRLVRLPLMRVREQETIAAFVDRETAKLDALVAKVREPIERLREYRTALISAAVTGKIDGARGGGHG
jgi:hypothetical protein